VTEMADTDNLEERKEIKIILLQRRLVRIKRLEKN
jgi:hypothetical protein